MRGRNGNESIRNGCTIALVNTGPQLVSTPHAKERTWLPLVVAAVIVLAIGLGLFLIFGHGKSVPAVTPLSTPPDPYAANLSISGLEMSEASNLAGGKTTYLDGKISNNGNLTVNGITVQVLFRDMAHEVTWNETEPLRIIRTRDPYIDVEPLAASPLKPGGQADFRLVFDTVPQAWDGAYPEIRLIHVDAR